MVSARAFVKTALSLTLAGFVAPTYAEAHYAGAAGADLPLAQQNRWAPQTTPDEGVSSKGVVLLRRTEEATPPPTQAELDEKLRQMASQAARSAAFEVQTQTLAQMTARQNEVNRLTNQTAALLKQTQNAMVAAESRMTTLAQSNAAQTAAVLQAHAGAQQTALNSLDTQNRMLQAELSGLQNQTTQSLQALAQQQQRSVADTREYARLQALSAQLAAQKEALVVAQQQTQSAEARMRQAANRQWVAQRQLTNAQIAQLAENTSSTVTKNLAALQSQVEKQRLTPDQVKEIASQTVANSEPEFRAVALQAMKDSQDYIRTVAKNMIQSKDPAVADALSDTVKDIIVKDNRIVFAMRKAVADGMRDANTAQMAAVSPSIKLGNGWKDPSVAGLDNVNIDGNRLKVAQIQPLQRSPLSDAFLAALSPAAGNSPAPTQVPADMMASAAVPLKMPVSSTVSSVSLQRAAARTDLGDLRKYRVVLHEDNKPLDRLLTEVLQKAEPFVGPWQIKWKISDANKDILDEKFSLDAETSFDEFVAYIAQYMGNERGVKLSFSLFDAERIIVVSD